MDKIQQKQIEVYSSKIHLLKKELTGRELRGQKELWDMEEKLKREVDRIQNQIAQYQEKIEAIRSESQIQPLSPECESPG